MRLKRKKGEKREKNLYCFPAEQERLKAYKMKTRKWKAEEKLAIVLCGIKGEKSISEICREHQISQTQYYKWRDKFFEGVLSELNSENGS